MPKLDASASTAATPVDRRVWGATASSSQPSPAGPQRAYVVFLPFSTTAFW